MTGEWRQILNSKIISRNLQETRVSHITISKKIRRYISPPNCWKRKFPTHTVIWTLDRTLTASPYVRGSHKQLPIMFRGACCRVLSERKYTLNRLRMLGVPLCCHVMVRHVQNGLRRDWLLKRYLVVGTWCTLKRYRTLRWFTFEPERVIVSLVPQDIVIDIYYFSLTMSIIKKITKIITKINIVC